MQSLVEGAAASPGGVVVFQRRISQLSLQDVSTVVLDNFTILATFSYYVLFSSKAPFVGRVYKMSQPCSVD